MEKMQNLSTQKEFLRQEKSINHLAKSAANLAFQDIPKHISEVSGLSVDTPHLSDVLLKGDYQGIDELSSEYTILHKAKSLYHRLTRKNIKEALEDPNSKVEVSPEQKISLRYGLSIQDVVDDIDILWHEELVQGENATEIKKLMEDKEKSDKLLGDHGEFIYGLLRKNPEGQFEYLTYKMAYPKEIEKISNLIDGMMGELATFDTDEAKALISTHQELQTLLNMEGTIKDGIVKKQEEQAKKLDTVWVTKMDQSKMDIDVLYPMEAYSAGNFVEWQYDILVKIPEFEKMNKEAGETKEWMYQLLKNDPAFKKSRLMQDSLSILEPTQAVVYLRLPSGTSERFRSAASNVPNNPAVRLGHDREDPNIANGSKINFDFQTFLERSEIGKPLVENVFGKDRAEEIFGDTKELIPILLSRFVAGHEDAHNLLESEKTFHTMGIQLHMDMDETKADLASAFACFAPNFLTFEDKGKLAKGLFAEELRGLSRWGQRQIDRTHLNGNLMLIQLLMDTKILTLDNKTWNFDKSSDRKFTDFSNKAKRRLLELSKIYDAKDRKSSLKRGEKFQEKYFNNPSEDMLKLLFDSGIIKEDEFKSEMANRPKTRFFGFLNRRFSR